MRRARTRIPRIDNGHGTHVASTIAEATGNGIGETGLAYGATIMPVKVLDRLGNGDERSITAGIRYAAEHGAQVINLSFEFGRTSRSAREIPDIAKAVAYAHKRGVLVVAAAGNGSKARIAYPAALPDVVSVGAVTAHDCLADYSDTGRGLDLVAPGGGDDAGLDEPNCDPTVTGPPIYQMTFTRSNKAIHIPPGFEGTSMAAPHVSRHGGAGDRLRRDRPPSLAGRDRASG